MNIYLVSRTDNWGHDDYDAFVVIAESAESACATTPERYACSQVGEWDGVGTSSWPGINHVRAELVGTTIVPEQEGIVLRSFNAG